jgi:hypothetical protein
MTTSNRSAKGISNIAKVLTEVYAKALTLESASNTSIEKTLTEMSMSDFLLVEAEEGSELSEGDVNDLKESIEEMKAVLQKLSVALEAGGGKFDGTKAAVEALAGEIPDPGTLAGMIIDPNPKEIAKEAERINSAVSNAASAAASVVEAIILFSDNLSDAVADVPEEVKAGKTLNQLSELAKAGELKTTDGKDIKFPDAGKLKNGAEKALETPGWFQQAWKGGMDAAKDEAGSFMGQVGGFFKGLFGKKDQGIDPSTFSDEILECTLEELAAVTEGASAVKEEMTTAIEGTAEATTGVQAGAASAGEAEEAPPVNDPKAAEPRPEFDLFQFVKEKYPEIFKKIQAAGMKPEEGEAEEIDAEVESGDISPEVAAQEIADEVGAEIEGDDAAKKWKDIAAAISDAVEDKASADAVLTALADTDNFKDSLKDVVTFEEGYKPIHKRSLGMLLFEAETMSFEDLTNLGRIDNLGDDVDGEKVFTDIAIALNKEVGEEVVTDIPEAEEAEEAEGDEPAPASEEEGEEEVEDAQEELQGAIQDAMSDDSPPGVAIMKALDDWVGGLSDTSQKSMQAKDRIGGLKTNIQTALDGAAETLSKAIGDAIQQWRGDHEETLVKSRRFAKKNFDSLSELIPKMAQELLKKTDESQKRLTRGMVKKYVNHVLDRHFGTQNMLNERLVSRPRTMKGIKSVEEEREFTEELRRIMWSKTIGADEETFHTPTQVLMEDHNHNPEYSDDELISNRWDRITGLGDK